MLGRIVSRAKFIKPRQIHSTFAIRHCTTPNEQLLERWMRLFRTFDQDRNGVIDRNEFSDLLRSLEFEGKQEKIDKIFKKLDEDNSGDIDKTEYLKLMEALTETERDDMF